MQERETTDRPVRPLRRRRIARWGMLCLGVGISGFMAAATTVIGAYHYVSPSLPQAEMIKEIPLQIPLRIFSRDGLLIEEVGERRRILVTWDELPPFVVQAFVSAEDGRFFEHPGIDYQGIMRALFFLVTSGEISGGGSTITQQLARDYFLTREQLFTRKLREAFLAWQIEQKFTKEEIMALFLNKMFFGQRAYGVAAAAQVYYGKLLSEINIAEAATLAGVLPAPSEYNPVRSPANAGIRRSYVLNRMRELEYIDNRQLTEALEYPLESRLHGTKNDLSAPYVAEMVRREMLFRYGEDTYSAGYRVITTLDSKLQSAANYAVRNGLLEFTRRRGYRGPIATLELLPALLSAPYAEWPDELRRQLQDYGNPAGLEVALVTALNDDNSVDIVLQNGMPSKIEWHGIKWARPYVDRETTGPPPRAVADVLTTGDIVYVMPITIGGWALAQLPTAQSSVVAVDPQDGAITSLVGGLDFSLSKFNRAVQSARQPGSSFKPFIYSAALENGNTLATIVPDSPVVISSAALERLWRPVNYSGRFYGDQRIREALVRSMNLASVRLLLNHTGVGKAVDYLRPFGFNNAALPRNGSLALGGGNASPLDMAQAYATFANGGYAVKPYVIDAIIGPDGEMLYRAEPFVVCQECEPAEEAPPAPVSKPLYPVHLPGSDEVAGIDPPQDEANPSGNPDETNIYLSSWINAGGAVAIDDLQPTYEEPYDDGSLSLEQMVYLGDAYRPDATIAPKLFENVNLAERIISPENAFLIQDAMRDVIRRGTGIRARALGRTDLSGKTGTSNDRRDAWFAGFNSDLSSVVWVGYDDDSALGPREEGSRTALPIWIEFAKRAYNGVPNHRMDTPEGIVSVRISMKTGCPADASTADDVMFEYFREKNLPECEVDDAVPDIFNTPDDSTDLF